MFEDEIISLENQLDELEDDKNLIVFYGSSSIRLWTTMREDLSPLNVINLGFGGSSFGWCVHYYQRLFSKLKKPDHIVFYCGDNDLDNGLSPDKVLKKFRQLVGLTRTDFPKTPISVITIKPSPIRTLLQPKIILTNNLIRKELKTLPKTGQINVFDSMLNERAVARPELYLEDQLHLNEKGYKIWKGVIRKYFGI